MTKYIKIIHNSKKKSNIYSNKSIQKKCPRHSILFSGKIININNLNDLEDLNDLECRCNKFLF